MASIETNENQSADAGAPAAQLPIQQEKNILAPDEPLRTEVMSLLRPSESRVAKRLAELMKQDEAAKQRG